MFSPRIVRNRASQVASTAPKRSLTGPFRSVNPFSGRRMQCSENFATRAMGNALANTLLESFSSTNTKTPGLMSFSTATDPIVFGTQTTAEELGLTLKDPNDVSGAKPHKMMNLGKKPFFLLFFFFLDLFIICVLAVCCSVGGEWKESTEYSTIIDPWNGESFIQCPNTTKEEVPDFAKSLRQCPKSGLHNPLKNPERYVQLAHVSNKAGELLRGKMGDYFARLIQRVSPKSYAQARGEVNISAQMLENFSGDQVRFMTQSFGVPGDHNGQTSNGYRWPFGPCALITPFNFPLEIPCLQLMGALFMGNKVTLKVSCFLT